MVWMNPRSYSFNQLSILLHAPAKSGVYLLHNSVRCLYIGEAENIRQCLLERTRSDDPSITVLDPNGFSFELQSEASKVERKNQLIAEYQPAIENWDGSANDASLEVMPEAAKSSACSLLSRQFP